MNLPTSSMKNPKPTPPTNAEPAHRHVEEREHQDQGADHHQPAVEHVGDVEAAAAEFGVAHQLEDDPDDDDGRDRDDQHHLDEVSGVDVADGPGLEHGMRPRRRRRCRARRWRAGRALQARPGVRALRRSAARRRSKRARALAASTSRSLGAADVVSSPRSSLEIAATASTAPSKAAAFGRATTGQPADLAHVLERGGADLVLGRRRLEVVERSDVSAHAPRLYRPRRDGPRLPRARARPASCGRGARPVRAGDRRDGRVRRRRLAAVGVVAAAGPGRRRGRRRRSSPRADVRARPRRGALRPASAASVRGRPPHLAVRLAAVRAALSSWRWASCRHDPRRRARRVVAAARSRWRRRWRWAPWSRRRTRWPRPRSAAGSASRGVTTSSRVSPSSTTRPPSSR